MTQKTQRCLNCGRTEQEVPLIALQFLGGKLWICPQCLPVLIHSPQKLAGNLPGGGSKGGSEHHH